MPGHPYNAPNYASIIYKSLVVTGSKRELTASGATSRSFNRSVLIQPGTLVNRGIGSFTRDSIQEINTYEAFIVVHLASVTPLSSKFNHLWALDPGGLWRDEIISRSF